MTLHVLVDGIHDLPGLLYGRGFVETLMEIALIGELFKCFFRDRPRLKFDFQPIYQVDG